MTSTTMKETITEMKEEKMIINISNNSLIIRLRNLKKDLDP